MKVIKEPKEIDLLLAGRNLTEAECQGISAFIQKQKMRKLRKRRSLLAKMKTIQG